jgi:hexosaminidase
LYRKELKVKNQTQTLTLAVLVIMLPALTICGATATTSDNQNISVIPKPMEMKRSCGHFTLKAKTAIYIQGGSAEIKEVAKYLADQLRGPTGLSLVILQQSNNASPVGSFLLTTENADCGLGDEGYQLSVTEKNVILRAAHPAGLFYGVQTIRQLLPPQIESRKKVTDVSWAIPCLEIRDKPRFGWRGSLLDCCRQFMSTDFIKRYIELLSYHKMNRFHWHLTDDPGWRIEIKKYPKLTEIGSWRNTGPGNLRPPEDPPQTDEIYGGYYTQEDIRDIVEYAKSRYVTVVPEIEMPGHSSAALAGYPELSCTGGPFEVKNTMGISKDVYCAGNEKTFEFLEDMLSEVIELFPGLYLHIGGDECPKDRWKECPKCQARIKAEGLKDEHELQSYFVKRIEKFLLSKNRKLVGWDEILEGGLAPAATVQSWRGTKGGIAAATSGHDAIMSPTTHCYFDYPHSKKEAESFPDWMGVLPTEKVYSFEPMPEGLSAEHQHHILGGEGNVWTEVAPQEEIDSRAYPRLTALAEVLWSPKQHRNWDDFSLRLKSHYKRLDILGVDYYSGEK